MASSRQLRVGLGNMRIAHHASHSGYHLLESVLAELADVSLLCQEVESAGIGTRVLNRALRSGRRDWYSRESVAVEREAARLLRVGALDVAHLLWGESYLRWSGAWRRRCGTLVATFHQPPEILHSVGPTRRQLRSLDGAVALAGNQRDYLVEIMGSDKVAQVPHGLDTDFFSADDRPRADARCLVVGQWLRDTDTLAQAAALLAQRAPEVRIQLVGAKDAVRQLGAEPNVEFMPRLTDEELRDLYRTSSALLLPLRNSTANCGLLEALGTGTPIVCSDVGGVRDYVNDECAVFAEPRNAEALVDALLTLLGDSARRRQMSIAAAARAADYSWPKVAQATLDAYASFA